MRVLVTGGAGYIGSHTSRDLVRRGHHVTVLDDLSTGHERAIPGIPLERCEISSGDVDAIVERGRFDAVIHFIARCLVPESVSDPSLYWRVNAMGSLRLLDACVKHGVKRIVFSSTCATYGLPVDVPIGEDHPQRPITSYGKSKLATEHALSDYAIAYGLGSISLRYFNAAGAAQDGAFGEDHAPETHLVPNVLRAALTGEPVRVAGDDWPTPDGTCIRDYVHIADLASAHALALEAIEPGKAEFLNVGTGTGTSVREVIAAAERVTGRSVPSVIAPRRPGDPSTLVAKNAKLKARLGFTPAHTIDDIVRTAWAWHSSHPQGYADRGAR